MNFMKTLNVSISELEFNKFGLKRDNLTFSELIELVSRELMRQNFEKCLSLSQQYGIAEMTMEEINQEVKAVRDAKNRD